MQPIAAIVADYEAVPVVLDPGLQDAADDDATDLAVAWRELLIPQATVVTLTLAQARRLVSLVNEDDERAAGLSAADCARELIGWGAEFALISDADPGSSLVLSELYDDSGLVCSDTVPRRVGRPLVQCWRDAVRRARGPTGTGRRSSRSRTRPLSTRRRPS